MTSRPNSSSRLYTADWAKNGLYIFTWVEENKKKNSFDTWQLNKIQTSASINNTSLQQDQAHSVKYYPRLLSGFPGGSVVKNSPANAGYAGLNSGLGRLPLRRKWQPTPVFLWGKSHGQKNLGTVHRVAESDLTQWLNNDNNNNSCFQVLRQSWVVATETVWLTKLVIASVDNYGKCSWPLAWRLFIPFRGEETGSEERMDFFLPGLTDWGNEGLKHMR